MIKFFRRIRQRVIAENEFSKYLIYATGEIFLVVVGILIALQVHNTNENRKQRIEEIKILKEIKNNLITTKNTLKNGIMGDSIYINSNKIIIQHLTYDLPFHDSLIQHFYGFPNWTGIKIASSGYETLKSKGLDLISNDSLRMNIITFFDITFHGLVRDTETIPEGYRHHLINPELIKHFSIQFGALGDATTGRYPVDYDNLIKDQRFENMVREVFDNKLWQQHVKKEAMKELLKIIEGISKELDRIE